ncbi:MAG: hypothetical protein ACK2T3_05485, partial [Candidatus Promineifilaceae bacterium]
MVNRFPKLGTEIPIALFLLLVSICLFLPVFIQSDVLVYNGDIDLFFPNEVVIQDSMTRGDSLLWNPYFGAGSPGLGRIQLGLFYPPMFLMRHLMPIVSRFNWDAVFNVFLAGYGMYWFVRDLVRRRTPAVFSALAFMLSGSIIPRIFAGHVSVLHSIIWAGWLLFAYRRMLLRKSWWYLILTIVFSSLVLLGGQPQMSGIVLILPVSFFIFVYAADKIRHKSWSDLAEGTTLSIAAGILSLTLIAVQLLPFLEWLPWTQRGAGEAFDSLEVMLRQSVQLPNLLTPFMPLAWASPERALTIQFSSISHFWETSPFVGILTLVLAVLSVILVDEKNKWLARFLIGTALVATFLSIGPGNPIYTLLLEDFPYIRAPGRFLILWTFALSVLAGLALDGLLSRWSLGSERGFPIKAAAGISAFSLAVVLVVVGWNVSGMTVPRFLINQFRYDYSLGFVQDLLQRSSIILALTVLVISALFWLPVILEREAVNLNT